MHLIIEALIYEPWWHLHRGNYISICMRVYSLTSCERRLWWVLTVIIILFDSHQIFLIRNESRPKNPPRTNHIIVASNSTRNPFLFIAFETFSYMWWKRHLLVVAKRLPTLFDSIALVLLSRTWTLSIRSSLALDPPIVCLFLLLAVPDSSAGALNNAFVFIYQAFIDFEMLVY